MRYKNQDDPPFYSVDQLNEEAKNEKSQPCHVCGKETDLGFFGYPCCDPYDDNGRRVSTCKDWLRETTGTRR